MAITPGEMFREYERPEGLRGSTNCPEYRIRALDCDEYFASVDDLFTFDPLRAEYCFQRVLEDYGAGFSIRLDGEWELIKRQVPADCKQSPYDTF